MQQYRKKASRIWTASAESTHSPLDFFTVPRLHYIHFTSRISGGESFVLSLTQYLDCLSLQSQGGILLTPNMQTTYLGVENIGSFQTLCIRLSAVDDSLCGVPNTGLYYMVLSILTALFTRQWMFLSIFQP
jgi:hypothetical protein